MLIRVDNYKIYIVEQGIRNKNIAGEDICKGIVESIAYPEIERNDDGTIVKIFIQGDESQRDDDPLVTNDINELRYVISQLKAFCNHFDEPFGIVGGRLKLT